MRLKNIISTVGSPQTDINSLWSAHFAELVTVTVTERITLKNWKYKHFKNNWTDTQSTIEVDRRLLLRSGSLSWGQDVPPSFYSLHYLLKFQNGNCLSLHPRNIFLSLGYFSGQYSVVLNRNMTNKIVHTKTIPKQGKGTWPPKQNSDLANAWEALQYWLFCFTVFLPPSKIWNEISPPPDSKRASLLIECGPPKSVILTFLNRYLWLKLVRWFFWISESIADGEGNGYLSKHDALQVMQLLNVDLSYQLQTDFCHHFVPNCWKFYKYLSSR